MPAAMSQTETPTRAGASGPPVMEQITSRGCARRSASSAKPSLAMAPGLRFCTNTSALASIAASSALSSSRARSSTTEAVEPHEIRALSGAMTVAGFRKLVVVAREVALGPLDLDHARAGVGEPARAHG